MTFTSYTPTNKIVLAGSPTVIDESKVETATGMVPGVLVKRGTSDDDIVVCTAGGLPTGVLGWEDTPILNRPADIDTAYTANTRASVLRGGDFVFYGMLASSQTITKGDPLVTAASGQLQKAAALQCASGASTASAVDATRPTVSGNLPASGVIVAYAEETITTTGSAARIKARYAL